jgi:hypothetical protein
MKRRIVPALLLVAASYAFAAGPLSPGKCHAVNGYDHSELTVAVDASSNGAGLVWLSAVRNFQLSFSERDMLLRLVRTAAKKVDIAIANKTTISYRREVGRFYTDGAILFTVSFETDGYGLSNTIVQIQGGGDSVILMFNQKDGQDFIGILGNLVDDYRRQAELFDK